MTFPSWQYLVLFLPAVCVIHWALARRQAAAGVLFLTAVSLGFYTLVAGASVLVLLLSVLVNGVLGRLLLRPDAGMAHRRVILGAGILANIGLILWVRGADPALGLQHDAHQSGLAGLTFASIGVSFFSMQQIAFLFDCHRRVVKDFRPSTFCLSSVFFPHLLAGPIVRYRELAQQIEAPAEKRTPKDGIAMGLTLLTIGLAKHVMIALPLREYLSPVLDSSAGLFAPVFPEAAIILVALALFIYFDFSAYSDMACGAACLLGYRMPVNFLSPLKSLNAAEFWRRWHITLSRFMRDYVFLPINAMTSRALKRRGILREEIPVVAATMATFLAMGLWHGASERFIAWGLSVGALVSVAQVVSLRRARKGERAASGGWIARTAGGLVIAILTLSTTALFMAPSLDQAVQLMRGLVGLNGVSLPSSLRGVWTAAGFGGWEGQYLVFRGWFPGSGINVGFSNIPLMLLLIGAGVAGYVLPNAYEWMAPQRPVLEKVPEPKGLPAWVRWRPVGVWALILGLLATASLGMLANYDPEGFVYFRF